MTKTEIDEKYQQMARDLESEFFDFLPGKRQLKDGKQLTEFDQRQAEIWQNHKTELVATGLLNDNPAPVPTDWKALWLAADTPAKKLAVIAQRLGLE